MTRILLVSVLLFLFKLQAQEQFYIKSVVNAKKVEFVVDDKGLYSFNKEYSKNDSCVISSHCKIPLVKTNELKPHFVITLNIFGKGYCEDFEAENFDYLKIGPQVYSINKSTGYVVTYTDEKGALFSSDIKKQLPTAFFNISAVKDYEDSYEIENRIIEGTFSCTLYNVKDPSKTIELKAVAFKVPISKY